MSSTKPRGNQTDVSRNEEPTPEIILETLNAHQRSAALRGAIELDLFTAIAEGAQTVDALAERCEATSRGVRILCDYLTVIEFLTKEGERYGLTPTAAAFLDRNSPSYVGSVARFVNSPALLKAFDDVAELVRQGTTLLDSEGAVTEDWEGWVEFARSMAPLAAPTAEFLGELAVSDGPETPRILDVAAGHGLFGIAAAKRNPHAEVVALDWPRVLEVARENAREAGMLDRYHLLGGDARKMDYGEGHDVVLATNIFHHFDPPTCKSIMRKMHSCLNPGGRVITLEFVPNEDRVSPPGAARFALMMLGATPSGDAYTFSEYDQMFRAAGFERNETREIPKAVQRVIISYR